MKEHIDKKAKTVMMVFESALDSHQWGIAENDERQQDYCSSQNIGSAFERFSGTATYADAVKLASEGYDAGTQAILRMVKEIEANEDTTQRGYDFDVTGDFFDVGEVIQGTPECWLQPALESAPRVISIAVNVSQSSSVKAQQITNRGAALIALVDRLQETPGLIVDLTVYDGAGGLKLTSLGNHYGDLFQLHNVGTSPLPMQEVGYMLAHPAFLRRGAFAVIDRATNYNPQSYGNVTDLPQAEREKYTLHLGSDETSNGLTECNTTEGAVAWINRQIESLGL